MVRRTARCHPERSEGSLESHARILRCAQNVVFLPALPALPVRRYSIRMIPPTSRGTLRRVLGVSFGVAVLIGNTILIGILRTPGDVAAQLPSPALFIGV